MKSIEISILLIFYFFGTAAAQKESVLAAETSSLELPEQLADSPLPSRSERVQEGRKLQAVCRFCPNGVSYPDLMLPVQNGATCGQIADYAQTLTAWNPLCATAEYAEVLCCPGGKNGGDSGKSGKNKSSTGSYSTSMSVGYGGKGGKKSGSGRGGKGGKR